MAKTTMAGGYSGLMNPGLSSVPGNAANVAVNTAGYAADTAVGLAGKTGNSMVDLAMAQPKKADMHAIGKATLEQNIAYREKLDNVSATAAAADNVMNVITDPKKILGIIMLVGLLVLLVYLMKDQLKSLFGWIGDFFKKKKQQDTAVKNSEVIYEDSTGLSPNFENIAQEVADNIYGAISIWGDDEETIYRQLRRVKTTADWLLVIELFGEKRWGTTGKGGLEVCLGSNLNDKERQKCRDILTGNGVSDTAIGF